MKADYSARGVLYVNSQSLLASLTSQKDSNSYWVTPAQATASEINELMKTDAFVRAIIKQTKLESEMTAGPIVVNEAFVNVRKQIAVMALGENQTSISASDQDPIVAYQLVNSLIDNYIQWKMNSKKTESQSALDFFSNLITTYKVDLENSRTALIAYISEHPEPIRGDRPFLEQFEIDRLNGQISIAEDRLKSALDKEENSKLSLQQIESDTRQTYVVMDAPDIPVTTSTSLKKTAISLAVFLFVGLFLSAVLVVGGYLLDRTVRFSLDVSTQLNLPVLAVIPNSKPIEPHRLALISKLSNKILKSRATERKSLNSGNGEIVIQGIDSQSTTEI